MTTATERMRKMRERRELGIRVVPVEVQIDTVETLIELNYLTVEDAHDFGQIANALARFVEDSTDSVTCHSITLDAW